MIDPLIPTIPSVAGAQFLPVPIIVEDDLVEGGFDGAANRSALALSERDDYLKTVSDDLARLLEILKGRVDALDLSSGASLREALLLSWSYKEDSPSFELFSDGFSWRDIAPIPVVAAVAGDDTLDLATTEGLKVGNSYVLMDPATLKLETFEVFSVLSATRIRTRLNLANTLTQANNAFVARTSFEIRDGFALAGDGDVFYTRVINELRAQPSGLFVIRRPVDDAGTLTVAYRTPTTTAGIPYATAVRIASMAAAGADGFRDEFYQLNLGGLLELKITYANANTAYRARIEHMLTLPPAREIGNSVIAQPAIVAPADQAANVGQTPTITLSPFYELYGRPQGGARFQIARDPAFADLVLDTDSQALAGWNAVSGQSAAFTGLIPLGQNDFLAIANGVSLRFQISATDGTITTTPGTVTGSLNAVAGSIALVAAVGAAGVIRTSQDAGLTYTSRTLAGGGTPDLNGVYVRNAVVVVVGGGGTIQRSVNGGAIFTAVPADASFAGAFTDIAGDGAGNLVAVGVGGAIQTSNDDGATWIARAAPGNFNGDYQGVAMGPGGFVLAVGANGAIHKSLDYGATWAIKAPGSGATATFYAVAIQGVSAVVVGAGGAIQTSPDKGETWTARTAGGGTTSAFRAVALDPAQFGFIVGDAGAVQKTLRLIGAVSSYTVPGGILAVNRVYWVRGLYYNQLGSASPFSASARFATAATFTYVDAPQVLAPASGDTGVSLQPTIQLSAFRVVGGTDTHAKSRYQIATDQSFGSPVYDSGEVNDLLVHTITATLQAARQYYVRAYQKGTGLGQGAWSAPVGFACSARPNKPVITAPVDGASQVALSPTITLSAFSMAGGGAHRASQYQVSTRSAFDSLVHDSGVLTASLLAYTVPSGTLAYNQTYYLRARQQESGGQFSQWADPVRITTTEAVNVTKLFNEIVYRANGGTQAITTGVDTTQGGFIWAAGQVGGPQYMFSITRGIGQRMNPCTLGDYPCEGLAGQRVVEHRANGFLVGKAYEGDGGDFNQEPFGRTRQIAWSFDPRLARDFGRVAHTQGAATQIDISSFGTVGMAILYTVGLADNAGIGIYGALGPYVWHRELGNGQNFKSSVNKNPYDGSVGITPNYLTISGGVATISDQARSGTYVLLVFRHDPSANGASVAGLVNITASGTTSVTLPWKPQFLIEMFPQQGNGLIRSAFTNAGNYWEGGPYSYVFGGSGARTGAKTTLTDTGFSVDGPEDVGPSTLQRAYWAIRAPGA